MISSFSREDRVRAGLAKLQVEIVSDPDEMRRYWQIGQAADELGVTRINLRFYCDYFRLTVKRNAHGNRLFTPSEFVRLRAIVGMLRLGLTMAAVKRLVHSRRHLPNCLELLQEIIPAKGRKKSTHALRVNP